jgi:hypothetical protein
MNPETKANALSAVALGLIGLCFALLLHEIVITRQQWQEIPRIFAGLFAPVPLAVFLGFCLASRGDAPRAEPSPGRMTLFLSASILLTIGAGVLIQEFRVEKSWLGSGPAVAESSVFTASILNFFFFRSPMAATALTGVSISLVVFVIFLT